MKFRQNKKHIDPRYFLQEQEFDVDDLANRIKSAGGAPGSPDYQARVKYAVDNDMPLPGDYTVGLSSTADDYAFRRGKAGEAMFAGDYHIPSRIVKPPSASEPPPPEVEPPVEVEPPPEIEPEPPAEEVEPEMEPQLPSQKDVLKQTMGNAQKAFTKAGAGFPAFVLGANTLTEIIDDIVENILKEQEDVVSAEDEEEIVGPPMPPPAELEKIPADAVAKMTTLPQQHTPTQHQTIPQTDYDPDAPPLGQTDLEKEMAAAKGQSDITMQSAQERIQAEEEWQKEMALYDQPEAPWAEEQPQTKTSRSADIKGTSAVGYSELGLGQQLPDTSVYEVPPSLLPGESRAPETGIRVLNPERAYPGSALAKMLTNISDDVGGVVIGDIGKRGGGGITGHKSHLAGKDVDMSLFIKGGGSSHNEPGTKSKDTFRDIKPEELDVEKTWAMLQHLAKRGERNVPKVDKVFIDQDFIDVIQQHAYREYRKTKTPDARRVARMKFVALFGHDPARTKSIAYKKGDPEVKKDEKLLGKFKKHVFIRPRDEDKLGYAWRILRPATYSIRDAAGKKTGSKPVPHRGHFHIRMRESVQKEGDLIKEVINTIVDRFLREQAKPIDPEEETEKETTSAANSTTISSAKDADSSEVQNTTYKRDDWKKRQ